MKTNYLFPSRFAKVGWIMLVVFVLFGFFVVDKYPIEVYVPSFFSTPFFGPRSSNVIDFFKDDITNEIALLGIIVSLLFIAFSREKEEDECIAKIRGESLVWAVIANTIIIIISIIFLYCLTYLYFLQFFPFILLVLFIIKFKIAMYKFNKLRDNGE